MNNTITICIASEIIKIFFLFVMLSTIGPIINDKNPGIYNKVSATPANNIEFVFVSTIQMNIRFFAYRRDDIDILKYIFL